MSRQDELESRLTTLLQALGAEYSDLGAQLPSALFHALVHRAVHHAAEAKLEYCTVATYLAEMVGHAHELMHGDNPNTKAHREFVH